jgi:hypothetical protein
VRHFRLVHAAEETRRQLPSLFVARGAFSEAGSRAKYRLPSGSGFAPDNCTSEPAARGRGVILPDRDDPCPRCTMIRKTGETENRQRGFAPVVVIQISWMCHYRPFNTSDTKRALHRLRSVRVETSCRSKQVLLFRRSVCPPSAEPASNHVLLWAAFNIEFMQPSRYARPGLGR